MLVQLNLRPSERQLRQFGFITLLVFGLMSLSILRRGGIFGVSLGSSAFAVASGLAIAGLVSGVLSLVAPRANRPLFLLLSVAAFPIGFVMSHVVMALLFFGVLTPIALVFRAIGRDPLERAWEKGRRSYWVDSPRASGERDYFRQF